MWQEHLHIKFLIITNFSIYLALVTVLNVLYGRFALILTITLRSKFYYYLYSKYKNSSLELVTGRIGTISLQNLTSEYDTANI